MKDNLTAQDLIIISQQLEQDSRMQMFIYELEKQGTIQKYLHPLVYKKLISELKKEPFFADKLGDNFDYSTLKTNFFEPLATMLLNSVYHISTDVNDIIRQIFTKVENRDFSIIFFTHLALKAYSAQISETINQYISEYMQLQKYIANNYSAIGKIADSNSLKCKVAKQNTDWKILFREAFPKAVTYDSDSFKAMASFTRHFVDSDSISQSLSFVPRERFFVHVFKYIEHTPYYINHQKNDIRTLIESEFSTTLFKEAEEIFRIEIISKAMLDMRLLGMPSASEVEESVRTYCAQNSFDICDDYINIVIYIVKKNIDHMMNELKKYLDKPDISHFQNGIANRD